MPSADFCCPVKVDCSTFSPDFRDRQQTSRGRFDHLQRATAGFTYGALDGYGLRDLSPARPTPYASYPDFVHRLAPLLHASFRPRLATTPLRFAITSPPSGCGGDLHPQAVEFARHTRNRPPKPKLRRAAIRLLRGVVLLRLGADHTTVDADTFVDDEIEAVSALVRPDDPDFSPEAFLVGALLRSADDVGPV